MIKRRRKQNETWCDHKLEDEMKMKDDGMEYCYGCDLCKLVVHCLSCRDYYIKEKQNDR